MKKLKLNLEDLRVESFELNPGKEINKGTIHGNEQPTVVDDTCVEPSCDGTCYEDTCEDTCGVGPTCDYATCVNTAACGGGNTCDYSCGSTCGLTCVKICEY
ncbi:MAG: hypothetical protein PVH88_04125 [Ignavibacteria bacterium]